MPIRYSLGLYGFWRNKPQFGPIYFGGTDNMVSQNDG